MAAICTSVHFLSSVSSIPNSRPPQPSSSRFSSSSSSSCLSPVAGGTRMIFKTASYSNKKKMKIVCMAPDEEKLTRRNPLDFPVEWERPKPGRRPDIFPQFSPMKTPLPPPLPYDPNPEEEEEEEEENKEEEEDPDKQEPESRWFPFRG